MCKYRAGIGYDIHQLTEGRDLIIGGVKIPYKKGLLGHSDADVLAHAIIDALLGAAALPDIGTLFPDTDKKYKNADSLKLLENVCKMVKKQGYEIGNIDSNIIAQEPKMMKYIQMMRENISRAAGVDADFVSVKAKTKEHLDAIGNGDAIETNAIVLIQK